MGGQLPSAVRSSEARRPLLASTAAPFSRATAPIGCQHPIIATPSYRGMLSFRACDSLVVFPCCFYS